MSDQQLTDTKQCLRKRRSQRIELTVPVVVHRPPKEGPQFSERAQTLVVNAHGALMSLAERVTPEQKLLMQNIDSGEQKECRVVYIEKVPMGPTKVAVEFTRPHRAFGASRIHLPIGLPIRVSYRSYNLTCSSACPLNTPGRYSGNYPDGALVFSLHCWIPLPICL